MRITLKAGKVSDLVNTSRSRLDWSWVRVPVSRLEPGDVLSLECPPGLSISRFRSTVLVIGRRIHPPSNWMFCVRTEGTTVHCFLAPPQDFHFKP